MATWNNIAIESWVLSNPLNNFATATGNVDLGGNRLINVADPVDPQDVATKNWISDNFGDGTYTSIVGTTNQITVVTVGGLATISIPTNPILLGDLRATGNITSNTDTLGDLTSKSVFLTVDGSNNPAIYFGTSGNYFNFDGTNIGITNSLFPITNNSINLGSASFNWATLYANGATIAGLTASQAVVTNASKQLASLGYATTATASTLVLRDGSGNITAGTYYGDSVSLTNTLSAVTLDANNLTLAGTTTLNNLTASQAVVTNASKQLASLGYATTATASTLVLRDGSGNITAGTYYGDSVSLTNTLSAVTLDANNLTLAGTTTLNNLTASQAVVTNASKQLASLGYDTDPIANTLAQRDASGNLAAVGLTATGIASISGDGNVNKFNITDSAANNVFNVDTTGASGYNIVSMDQTKLQISALSSNQLVQTDGDSYLLTSNMLPTSCSATSMTLTTPTLSGTVTVLGLTASQAVVTNASKQLASLGYATAATASTLAQRDASGNLAAVGFNGTSATLSGALSAGSATVSGTTTLSALTASQAVVTNASKQLASLGYATAATASTLAQRDASGNLAAVGFNGTSATLSGALSAGSATVSGTTTLSALTASQAVVTNASKQLASLGYATAATASTLAQRDASGNLAAVGFNGTSATLSGALSAGSATVSGTGNVNKFNITDSAANNVFNVDTTGASGYNIVSMDQTKLQISALSSNQLVQTDGDSYLLTSNMLPTSCSATSMTLTTPTLSGTVNVSGLTASRAVVTDASKNLASLAYATTATASTLAQRDASGNLVSNAILTTYVGFGGQTTWDLNIVMQSPNLVNTQARCPGWNTYSSRKLKENINLIKDPVSILNKLEGVEFTWIEGQGDNIYHPVLKKKLVPQKQIGFIAEDVAKILPSICLFDENDEATSMDYSKLVPLLVEAVKQLSSEVKSLRS